MSKKAILVPYSEDVLSSVGEVSVKAKFTVKLHSSLHH